MEWVVEETREEEVEEPVTEGEEEVVESMVGGESGDIAPL